jgi:hypothetical protein
MADDAKATVAVYLPADLVAKLEELKQDREADRDKSVEELVREMCQSYVDVREMARQELANMEELERSYLERPNDWDDAEEWAQIYPPEKDKQT